MEENWIPECSYGKTPLTRDYFEKNNWRIKTEEPDENGFIMWSAHLDKECSDDNCGRLELSVTNCMYDWRFALYGPAFGRGEGHFEGCIFVCTVEELETFLFDIVHIGWDYRINKGIPDAPYNGNKDIIVE